ncbi:hypothetical protein BJX99DRAFT_258133 [Aspergillus californicus]
MLLAIFSQTNTRTPDFRQLSEMMGRDVYSAGALKSRLRTLKSLAEEVIQDRQDRERDITELEETREKTPERSIVDDNFDDWESETAIFLNNSPVWAANQTHTTSPITPLTLRQSGRVRVEPTPPSSNQSSSSQILGVARVPPKGPKANALRLAPSSYHSRGQITGTNSNRPSTSVSSGQPRPLPRRPSPNTPTQSQSFTQDRTGPDHSQTIPARPNIPPASFEGFSLSRAEHTPPLSGRSVFGGPIRQGSTQFSARVIPEASFQAHDLDGSRSSRKRGRKQSVRPNLPSVNPEAKANESRQHTRVPETPTRYRSSGRGGTGDDSGPGTRNGHENGQGNWNSRRGGQDGSFSHPIPSIE